MRRLVTLTKETTVAPPEVGALQGIGVLWIGEESKEWESLQLCFSHFPMFLNF